MDYIITVLIVNIFILIVFFIISYRYISKYRIEAKLQRVIAFNEKIKADTYKQVGIYIERINRAVRDMDTEECHSIEMTIGSDVRSIVTETLHPNTKGLYNLIVTSGITLPSDEDTNETDSDQ